MAHLSKVVERIHGAIRGEVDEIGIVFTQVDDDLVVEENGRKLGIPNKLVPSIKKFLASVEDEDVQSFVSVVCSG